MKDIEKDLREKYDNVEVPDYMFDTSRVFKRVEEEKKLKKKKIISIAASVVIIILVAIALLIIMPNKLKEDEVVINEKSENVTNNISGKVDVINKEVSLYNDTSLNVISISIEKIEEYTIINNIPYTKVKATIQKSYLGNLINPIEAYIPGGVFSVKDLKENIKEDISDLSKYNDEDLLEVTYHKDIYIPIAEEGKTYISTLIEVDGDYFVDIDKGYGFKEYNPETNIVKDDMGGIELDINQYLESIKIQ